MKLTENLTESQSLLTHVQKGNVKKFFAQNPSVTKLSKGKKYQFNENGKLKTFSLPYSVIKTKEGGLYILFRAYMKNGGVRPRDDKYGKEKKLYGSGAYGVVKGGQHIDTRENFAIKIIKYGDESGINKEEEILKKVEIYKGSARRNTKTIKKAYTVMKVIPGKPLYSLKLNNNDEDNLTIMLNILKATKEMHEKNILHMDLGGQNIMVDLFSKDKTATIIDFGLSIIKGNERAFIPFIMSVNVNNYVAPEARIDPSILVRKFFEKVNQKKTDKVSTASDIYSLGYNFRKYFLPVFKTPLQFFLLDNLILMMIQSDQKFRPTVDQCILQLNTMLLLHYLGEKNYQKAENLLKFFSPAGNFEQAITAVITNINKLCKDFLEKELIKKYCDWLISHAEKIFNNETTEKFKNYGKAKQFAEKVLSPTEEAASLMQNNSLNHKQSIIRESLLPEIHSTRPSENNNIMHGLLELMDNATSAQARNEAQEVKMPVNQLTHSSNKALPTKESPGDGKMLLRSKQKLRLLPLRRSSKLRFTSSKNSTSMKESLSQFQEDYRNLLELLQQPIQVKPTLESTLAAEELLRNSQSLETPTISVEVAAKAKAEEVAAKAKGQAVAAKAKGQAVAAKKAKPPPQRPPWK